MKNTAFLFLLTIALSFKTTAQSINPWSDTDERELISLTNIKKNKFPSTASYYRLNLEDLKHILLTAPSVQNNESNIIVTIPNMDGGLETFKIWEDSNFDSELQANFPNIRAYTGIGITDPTAYLKISLSHKGIQTMTLRADKKAEFIEPYTTDGLVYALFTSREKNNEEFPFTCLTKAQPESHTSSEKTTFSNTKIYQKLRLALSCTAEYTIYHGGAKADALAAMNATMTRVNGIYEKDLAVKLELIANTTDLIYTNTSTDPYSNVDSGVAGSWNTELQNNLNKTIGFDNFDIGHLFGSSGGGGNANCIGCVCTGSEKGSAYTSPADDKPEGDNFDIDFVAHEMGHQLGAAHSFSYNMENTDPQVEPGSGSTIMGYAGITEYDIQKHSDAYFNYKSIVAIQNNLKSKLCPNKISTTNNPPTIYAGLDYTIPKSTAYILTGTGSDIDGDTITYSWEQNDSSQTPGANSLAFATKTTGPNFRSVKPSSSPVRYFPSLYTILSSKDITPKSTSNEALSSVSRNLEFVLTGRDNRAGGGQTNSRMIKITVDGDKGPLYVTSQNTENLTLLPGTQQIITWAVNNTNLITGAANVTILLSTDNGQTYPTVLLGNTPNDGSETITLPNILATNCRVMIKAANNIFFAINRQSFAIGYNTTTTCIKPTKTFPTSIPDGGSTFSSSILNVSDAGTVQSISVDMNLTHSNLGQLSFILVSPSNTQIRLISNSCREKSVTNGYITFTDEGSVIKCASPLGNILPQDPLYTLIGEKATGNWTLKFMDDTSGKFGSINSWSLNLCTQKSTEANLSNEDFKLNSLSLYPNPVNDILNISISDENSLPDDFTIYNSLGQILQITKVNSPADLSINTGKLSSGIYFIKINKEEESKTLRFIKK